MMLRYLFCILSNIDTISTMMSLDRVALTVRSFVYGDSSLSRCIDNDWHFVPGHWIYIYLDICIYWIYICIVTYIFNKVFHCFTITIFFLKDQGINILKSSQNGRLRLSPLAVGVLVAIDVFRDASLAMTDCRYFWRWVNVLMRSMRVLLFTC